MNIEKYGVCYYYGFGILDPFSYSSKFICNFKIVAKSEKIPVIEEKFTLTGYEYGGYKYRRMMDNHNVDLMAVTLNDQSDPYYKRGGVEVKQPIYVAFDGDSQQWREYFTGIVVEVASSEYESIFTSIYYDVDNGFPPSVVPFRKFAVRPPEIMHPTTFAERISSYSDKEIKDMVSQIQELSKDALRWGEALDNAILKVKNMRSQKESELSSVKTVLADSFGKYSSATHDSVNNNSLSDSGSKDSLRVQRIRAGRCTNCGGAFGGMFIKTCKNCGRRKDY